ncbi:MAG TPA: imidazolonepropionase [Bdellovibrionales bacterium]|nr:imidazolonepropionase [Bdellovibrionales bacterium]
MARSTLFSGIDRLVSMKGAAQKNGRRIEAADLSIVKDAVIVASGGKIDWVGPKGELPKAIRAKVGQTVNLGGATVLPAFVECHTHLIFAGNRAGEFERRLQGESYQAIAKAGGGILSTVKGTRSATEAELAKEGQKRVDRFLKQGVATVEIKSGYGLNVKEEIKILKAAKRLKKVRTIRTFLGAHAVSPDFPNLDAYVDHLSDVALPRIKKEKLAERVDIFIEQGFFTPEHARKYLGKARELGFGIAVHADQLSLSGGSHIAVEFGAQSAEHLIKIGNDEIAKLAKSDLSCVLLPSSDLYMKCDYPPARRLIDAGARVALATDFNPGSSPSQDLALVGLLARLEMGMSLPEVLGAYTVGAAHALGLGEKTGSIEVGKFCDFVTLDGEIEELFYEVGRTPVDRVFIDGKLRT